MSQSDGRTSSAGEPELQAQESWREDPVLKQFGNVAMRMPKYVRIAVAMARDEDVPRLTKATLVAGGAYVISPIDLIPGFIPVLGQLDDVLVLLLALQSAVDTCPDEVVEKHFRRVGLAPDALEQDLAEVRAAGAWVVERGIRVTSKIAENGKRLVIAGAHYLPGEPGQTAIIRWSRKKLDIAIATRGRIS